MVEKEILLKAFRLMCCAKSMTETYDANRQICKYVHSTSRGHEAIQLATAFHLESCDYVSPYYRDESMLLGLDYSPYELMLQLLTRADDPFTGGRSYYSHPNSKVPLPGRCRSHQAVIPVSARAHLKIHRRRDRLRPGVRGCACAHGPARPGRRSCRSRARSETR